MTEFTVETSYLIHSPEQALMLNQSKVNSSVGSLSEKKKTRNKESKKAKTEVNKRQDKGLEIRGENKLECLLNEHMMQEMRGEEKKIRKKGGRLLEGKE